jgi:hypothetical protein
LPDPAILALCAARLPTNTGPSGRIAISVMVTQALFSPAVIKTLAFLELRVLVVTERTGQFIVS